MDEGKLLVGLITLAEDDFLRGGMDEVYYDRTLH